MNPTKNKNHASSFRLNKLSTFTHALVAIVMMTTTLGLRPAQAAPPPISPLAVIAPVAAAPAPKTHPATTARAAPSAGQADLQISVHAASTTVVIPADSIHYNVTVTNTGPAAAQHVQVILNVTTVHYVGPLTMADGTQPAGWTCAIASGGSSRTCTRAADMPAGTIENFTFTMTPTIAFLFAGAYLQFTASSNTEDPDTRNNLATPEDVTVTAPITITSADMSAVSGAFELQNHTTPASIPAGSMATVIFSGRNNGPGSAAHTTTLSMVGGGLVMGEYDYEFVCDTTFTRATCLHGRVAPAPLAVPSPSDLSGVAPVIGVVLAPMLKGIYNHTVNVDGDLADPLPGNNTKNVPMIVTTTELPNSADVAVVSALTGPASVNPGATVFYTVTVRNNGPAVANNVLVWVPNFPRELPGLGRFNNQRAGALAPSGWNCRSYTWGSGWACYAPSMSSGETAALYFRFSAPITPGSYNDFPAIGSETGDLNTANNIGTAVLNVNTTTSPQANVHVTVTHQSEQFTLLSGDSMTMRFRVRNDGTDQATHAYVGVFWDIFNVAWSLVGYSAPAGWACERIPGYDGGMDCFKSSMSAGEDEEWKVVLRAPSVPTLIPMRPCVLSNSDMRNEAYEIAPYGNKYKFSCDEYLVTPFKANLRITGRDNPDPVNAGAPLSYTLVVHNDGPNDMASDYFRQLFLDVPAGVAFLRLEGPAGWRAGNTSATPGIPSKFEFVFPVLAAGQASTATVVVLAPAITTTLVATGSIRGSDFDVDLSNNQIVFNTDVILSGALAADLGITLSADPLLCLDATSRMTATVTNLGPDVALTPTVLLTVPAGLSILTATSSDFVCALESATTVRCQRTRMGVGSSSIVLSVNGVATGSGNIQASVNSNTPDGNQDDNVASAAVRINSCVPQGSGRIAYVFNGERDDALAYKSLLEGRGYTVALIGLSAITRTNLSSYDLFILADDSGRYPGDGEWFTWGTHRASTAAQMAPIIAANKPVIGLGEGGSIYLEKRGLSIGWLNAWYRTGDVDTRRPVPLVAGAVYASPNVIPADPVLVYNRNASSLNVYGPRMNSAAFKIGTEIPDGQHFNVTGESCHFGWGFRNDPSDMTNVGKNLFHNLVNFAIHFQCAPPVQPPPNCVIIKKNSDPPNGASVLVSDGSARRISLITYTLSYSIGNSPNCNNTMARLVDVIPPGTEYVPDSASDGISPDSSGALVWSLLPGSSGSKHFTVVLLDSACTLGDSVHNRARLTMAGRDPIESNEVKHVPVCPPVTGINTSPPFAQDELSVYPYPIIAGQMHTVSVRLTNHTITNTTVMVRLMNSANAFGIGIPFSTYATRTVTIPGNGNIVVQVPAVFARTGHYCICVEIDIPGHGTIRSCRNLDVMEDLRPGVPDTITFAVGNPLSVRTDIRLVVDNTCAGFTTLVAPLVLTGMAPGEVRSASLVTTPPNPVVLGSGCHIDVRGYYRLGSAWAPMNEGIRKLDVPPIQVSPPPGTPTWLSRLITFREEPLRAGVPNSICIELYNPLPITKVVTLTYQVANFGVGMTFTTVPGGVITVTLPPNSRQKYCVKWTPSASGRVAVQVIVQYPGYLPVRVQRNLDVYRNWRPDLTIPWVILNPDLISHTLRFRTVLWGIDPHLYEPVVQIPRIGGGGDPPPDEIGPGQQLQLQIAFRLRALGQTTSLNTPEVAQASTPIFGDVQQVDVAVEMDGKEVSGFSAVFEKGMVYLPIVYGN